MVLNEDNSYIIPSTVIVETCQLLKYRFGAGYVDSSLVAIAKRLGTNKIIKLDKRHFSAILSKGFE